MGTVGGLPPLPVRNLRGSVQLNSSGKYSSYLASFSNLAFLLSKSVFYHFFLTEMGDFVNMALRPLPAVRAGQMIRHFSGSYVYTRLIEGAGPSIFHDTEPAVLS